MKPVVAGTLGPPAGRGRLVVPAVFTPGLQTWSVLADHPTGIARVEMFVAGASVGLARPALPGAYDEGPGRQSRAGRAEITAVVPAGPDRVRLGAMVYPMSGEPFAVPEVAVKIAGQRPPAPERLVEGEPRDREQPARPSAADVTARGGPRVLVLAHNLGLGGAQLYLGELLRRLSALGLRGAVVSQGGGSQSALFEELGWPVLVTGGVDVTSPETVEGHVLEVASWAAEHGCTVALANTAVVYAGVDAAHRIGLPVVWAIHESLDEEQFWLVLHGTARPHPEVAATFARALATAERVLFVAEATRRLYGDRVGPGAGAVVRYGVDLDAADRYVAEHDRAEVRESLGIGPDTLLLLCLGTVEPRKGQLALAQAFLGSPALRGRDVVLALVGASGGSDYVECVLRFVEAYGSDKVRVVPLDPDSSRWHLAADVLVNASDNESMPRTMIEAMAFGRPVAGTRVFGVPELVTDGETGFLCEPRDVAALRAMLERVADTPPDELRAMGRRGRARVERDHDPRAYADYVARELERLEKSPGNSLE